MIEIKENFRLLPYNTFRIDVKANYFIELKKEEEIQELFSKDILKKNKLFILGGGSNVLFTQDFKGLVIHPLLTGVEIVDESEEDISIRVGCGVIWDEFVEYAVAKNWGGIENLSNIPGSVGASPVQNIGAYGREAKDVIEKVDGVMLSSGKPLSFTNSMCKFGYRNSIFKSAFRNDFMISRVTFRLKKPPHKLITHYNPIERELLNYEIKGIDSIRKIITEVRNSKLPQVEKIGNAGSFFKNPIVPFHIAEKIRLDYEDAPVYSMDPKNVKLSAAWLIDRSGCKGLQHGNAGTYDKQPLVLVNLGNATGQEILDHSKFIQQKVYEKFDVHLEPEVNIL
jgi:UDP-N-acetylmuramate dehydrogenase